MAILSGESQKTFSAGNDLTINGDVLFFREGEQGNNDGEENPSDSNDGVEPASSAGNDAKLTLSATNNVIITGTITNRPNALKENPPAEDGGDIEISGKNVTITGDIWNGNSHDDGTVMTITAAEKLAIIGNLDNQCELNITAGSLDVSGGYLNFDTDNFVTLTGTDNGTTPVATIGDGNIAPIIAAGDLTFKAEGGTVVINGGLVKDEEIIKDVPVVSGRDLAILGSTVHKDSTTQSFTAKTLQINGDIVAEEDSTVALKATGTGSFITGNILTTDKAKVTIDGDFAMDGAIAEDSKVLLESGSLTVDANTLGTVGKASDVTLGIQSSLTVDSGAKLILDLASLASNGSLFEYTQAQFDAAKKALFGDDDKGELLFAHATLVSESVEKWLKGQAWSLSSGTATGKYFGGNLADEKNTTASYDSSSITISSGKLVGEINGGGAAVGSGTTSHVGNVTINVTGGIITNLADGDSHYTAIRGGGAAKDGGTATVDKAVLNFTGGDVVNWNENSAAGEGGWTDIMGGGVAIGNGTDGSTSTTGEAVINIGKGFDLRGVGVFGGGDGDTVTKTTVTIADATSFNQHNGFEVFGGGMAGDGYDSTVGTATINIGGDRNVKTGTKEQRGAIYGGGKASSGLTAKVENVTINVTGGDLSMHDIYAGGLAVTKGKTSIKGTTDTGTATINVSDAIVGNIYGYGKHENWATGTSEADKNTVDAVAVTITGKTDVLGNIDLSGTKSSSSVTVDTNDFRLGGRLIGRVSNSTLNIGESTLNIGEKVVDFLDTKFTGFDTMTVAGTTKMLKADESSVGAFNSSNMTSDLTLSGGGELIANVNGITHKLTVTGGTTLNAQNISLDRTQSGALTVEAGSTLKTTTASIFKNEAQDVFSSIFESIKNQTASLVDGFDVDGNLVITDRVDRNGKELKYNLDQLDAVKQPLSNADKVTLLATLDASGQEITANELKTKGIEGRVEAKKVDVDADLTYTNDITTEEGLIVQNGKKLTYEHGENSVSHKKTVEGGITLENNSKLDVLAEVVADKIEAAEDSIIRIGKDTKAGILSVAETLLNGAHLFLDPVWDSTTDISNSSKAALGGNDVNGLLTVGRNSVLALGTSDTAWADGIFKDSGLTWGKTAVTAALAIQTPQKLTAGGIKVDGSLFADPTDSTLLAKLASAGNAEFADNSLLMVESSAASNGAALTGTGSGKLTIADTAKLYIHNATVGTYTITDEFAAGTDKWADTNIVLNPTVKVSETVRDGGKITVTTELTDIRATFPTIVAANSINAMHSGDENAAGVVFLKKALEPGTGLADVQGVLDDTARGAVTAGVQNTALRVADAASNAVLGHMSLAQHDGSKAIHSDGVDFWAAPMYGNLYTSGMVSSGASVRGQFGGLALGADMEAANVYGGKLRVGASINGGGGQSESKGSAMQTQNDYGFGGLNLYAGWNHGAFNVVGSVGYSFGDHDIEMSEARMGTLKGNVDTSAITADLRAEYQLKTGWLDVLPHVGVRYTALKTGSHDMKLDGAVVNSLASETQHILQFPVGVTLSKDFEMAGWNVKPMADVSFIPAAGDKDTEGKVRFSGINASDSFNARVMDSCSWAGTVGVQAEKDNFSLGLNYGVQASSHETDQNIQLKLSWKF